MELVRLECISLELALVTVVLESVSLMLESVSSSNCSELEMVAPQLVVLESVRLD